jgi:hypothetical protein
VAHQRRPVGIADGSKELKEAIANLQNFKKIVSRIEKNVVTKKTI